MKTFLYGLLLVARIINGQMTDSQPIKYDDEMHSPPMPDGRTPDYYEDELRSPPMPAGRTPVLDYEVDTPDYDEYEICYNQCKIQTPYELTDINISRVEEGSLDFVDDSEKMCFHSCINAEFGDTQSSPASTWEMSTATAAILFVR